MRGDRDGDDALELAAAGRMATANGYCSTWRTGTATASTRWGSCDPGGAPPLPMATTLSLSVVLPLPVVLHSHTEQGQRRGVGAAEQRRARIGKALLESTPRPPFSGVAVGGSAHGGPVWSPDAQPLRPLQYWQRASGCLGAPAAAAPGPILGCGHGSCVACRPVEGVCNSTSVTSSFSMNVKN
jgi:hypothetical protein